jgi:Na(+)-translocating NADH:ubiquinone oxidoreductase A subunit
MIAKTFSGGYRFKGFKGQPQDKLVSLGIPPKVSIPLFQGFGSPPKPLVKVGDKVGAGQIIGRDDNNVSSPVHSSINGKVVAIGEINYFKREVTMVTIKHDGTSGDYKKIEGCSPNWDRLPSETIERLLYESGVTSLDREGIPTRFKTSIIMPEEVEDLIIHGAGSEVYNTSLNLLLEGENAYNFIEGVKILKKIMPKARVHLAVSERESQVRKKIKKLTHNSEKCEVISVVPKYPQGYDEVLVPTILNKRFPYGYSAANIGIVVLNIQAVCHAFEAVTQGKPLIERIVALCGPSFKEPVHVKARVGTPLEFIFEDRLKDASSRVILNSLLTGFELNNFSLPIDRTFSQILAIPDSDERKFLAFLRPGFRIDSYSKTFASSCLRLKRIPETNLHGEERPCIQCGYCISACPVSIMPALLDRIARAGVKETLMKYGIFNCIDCNLCSYVCPSKVPLAKNLRQAKAKLIDIGCDNSLCILPRFNLKGLEEYKGIKVTK